MVWVTQEGDQRDIFLSDREEFVFERPGTGLVEAITETHLLPFVSAALRLDLEEQSCQQRIDREPSDSPRNER